MMEINIGVIADGATDYKILGKIARCLLVGEESEFIHCQIIPLGRKNIHDPVQDYLSLVKKNQQYYFPDIAAGKLCNDILAILKSAFSDFNNNFEISSKDIVLLTTDSEITLKKQTQYFTTIEVYGLSHILLSAIDKFYEFQANCFYPRQSLPRVIPLVTFPSTEILVAGAKNLLGKHYGKKPRELKQLLYNTEHPTEEDLEEHALRHITLETIEHIFRDVPESRMFLQALSTGFKPCIAGDPSLCRQTENETD